MIEKKKSPEVVSKQLKENAFYIEISGWTIRNAIKSGLIIERIEQGKIKYKKEKNNKYKEKSIKYRPKEANSRKVNRHWEGDLVVGKQGTKIVLFTLTERMTRQEIIIKLPNKETKTIAKAIDKNIEVNFIICLEV